MDMPPFAVDSVTLGALQAVHKRSLFNVVGPLFLAVLIPAAAAAMVYAVIRFVPPGERETMDKAWLLAAASVIGSLVLLWSWAKNLGLHVDVHELGFVLHRRSQTQACRWDDIAELWSTPFYGPSPGGGRQTKAGYTVRKRDGTNILLTPALAGLERLAGRVREETYRRMMPWALSQFQAGGQVSFGMYSVSRQGLAVTAPQVSIGAIMLSGGAVTSLGAAQTTFMPWSEFSQVRPESQWLRLVRPGLAIDWTIVYRMVPNMHVLLALLQQVFPNVK
ncbi:MAG: hypothetical protein HY905_06335 [Deltaproteobacteria bacterium]|nr:hypothetical protein [Deltaproteobacteria bacterium]